MTSRKHLIKKHDIWRVFQLLTNDNLIRFLQDSQQKSFKKIYTIASVNF